MNTPFSSKRSRIAASAVAGLSSDFRLSGGFERVETDRDFQEVGAQTEDIGWGKVRWTPSSTISIDSRAGTAKREVDFYDTDLANSYGQNPLLRKYNLAHRFREFGELRLLASFAEKPVSFSVGVMLSDDDYSKSVVGLLSSKEKSVSADVNWSISERSLASVWAGIEQINAKQAGGTGQLASRWFASHEDEFMSYGFGLHLREIRENIDVRLDFSRGIGTSQIQFDSSLAAAERFPDLASDLDTVRLSAAYQHSARTEWNAELRYERLQTSDWALNDVGPDTVPLLLSLGAEPFDYSIFQVGVSFRHHFGSGAVSAGRN